MGQTDRALGTLPDFVMGMIEKIDANGHKPGWRNEWLSELFWLLRKEVDDELRLDIDSYLIAQRANEDGDCRKEMRDSLERARKECYDVANFAYMIEDKCRMLLAELEVAAPAREVDDAEGQA